MDKGTESYSDSCLNYKKGLRMSQLKIISGLPGAPKACFSAVVLSVLLLLTGCVSPAQKPPAGAVEAIKSVFVVPMEPPPLKLSDGLPFPIPVPIVPLGMIAVVPLMEPNTNGMSSVGKDWTPTGVLATNFQKLIAGTGRTAVIASNYKAIPDLTNREITNFMENWFRPTRNWYGNTDPVLEYKEFGLANQAAVVEVGVLNYEILNRVLAIQTMVKLIRPDDGVVVGRTRAWRIVDLVNRKDALANDGAIFRAKVRCPRY